MRYGLELKIPRLSNKVMEMKNETNNLEAASIDASTNAVQRRCAEVRAGRPNARERRPTHGRLEWKPDGRLFGGRKRLEAPSRRRSLQTCLWIFFSPSRVRPCSATKRGPVRVEHDQNGGEQGNGQHKQILNADSRYLYSQVGCQRPCNASKPTPVARWLALSRSSPSCPGSQ